MGLILPAMKQMKHVFLLCFLALTGLRAQTQQGLGTFYHVRHWGSKTTSGEPYHPFVFSAAHRSLPLGTWVEVEFPKTGKKTIVRINDRGPFLRGGVIDVSKVAAQELGLVSYGISKVKVRPLSQAELTDSLQTFLLKRDSLAKAENPTPIRKKSSKKKKSKKRKAKKRKKR
jgi:rare lipoprotein A